MLEADYSSEAFEARCAPYSAMVYRHCFQMLKNKEEAEDAAQETMLRAFRAFPRHNGTGVATWLFRIAHNICLDIFKSARYRKEKTMLTNYTETYGDTPSTEKTPEQHYIQNEQSTYILQAIQKLDLLDQTLLSLYYQQGLRYHELAQATGVSEGTVKSRLSRAKEKLRKRLGEDFFHA